MRICFEEMDHTQLQSSALLVENWKQLPYYFLLWCVFYIILISCLRNLWDFPGGPSCNAGDTDLIPGQGIKIARAMGQLSPYAATTEPMRSGARAPQWKIPHATTKT